MPLDQRLARDVADDVDEIVDGHQFIGSKIEWRAMVGPHDAVNAFNAVIDVHERSRLLPVAPDLDLAVIREYRDFPANCGWGFLAASVIGAERPVDIMETHDSCREAPVLGEVLTELLHV